MAAQAQTGAASYRPTSRIRLARQEKFMTIADLANASGVHYQTIWRVENGHPAKASTIRKLARVLGVEPSELAEL